VRWRLVNNPARLDIADPKERELKKMPHTIVTDVCEGVADCVDACPVACIHPGPGKNVKGTDWYWIDFATCIDCGICIQVCPVTDAILPEERPDLQKTP
jgi:NAD-dependent dihydropyrimidine dehydrogenase PreA subunit